MMASAAGGKRAGVSKAATIIPVKFSDTSQKGYGAAHQLFEALQWIISDVITKGSYRQSVINYSNVGGFGYYRNPHFGSDQRVTDPWFHILPILARHGITVVTGAGNDAKPENDAANWSPLRYAMDGEVGADTLIVVGASDRNGAEASFSNRFPSAITAYAPGKDVLVLDESGQYGPQSGTSISTALVSGLVANWLKRDDIATKLDKAGTPRQDYTKKIKAFVKEAAAYATNPDKTIKGEFLLLETNSTSLLAAES